MKKKSQAGIAHLMLIGFLIVLAVLGGAFWYVKDHNKTNSSKSDTTQTANQNSTSKAKKQYTADDKTFPIEGGVAYNLTYLTKTDEQKNIALGIKNFCGTDWKKIYKDADLADLIKRSVFTTSEANFFNTPTLFIKDSGWVKLNGNCLLTPTTTGPGGGAAYILKLDTETNKWQGVVAYNGTVECKDVDGTGIPSTMLKLCYDGNNPRAPH